MEEPAVRMDLVAEEGGGGHKEESKELLPAGEGMEPVEVCRLSIIQLLQRCAGQIFVQLIYFTYPLPIRVIQGGRSCTGARVAPAEKFGLGRKF